MQRRHALSLLAAVPALSAGAGAALAENTPQTLNVLKIDVVKVATGYRASKIIGKTVVNDGGESIGKVDDLIVSDGKVPYLILSVGGFLGVGSKLIALPYETVKIDGDKLTLPGATKDALKGLPEFKYRTS
ncbi:MAG TPA: PRC-barrel domain-containing protein [Reyranella sp.]|jgi:sporulation protein YlmC with PRC-barrel domain|nr:PRC-barrel domain-containing protein [Reyranella sp.]